MNFKNVSSKIDNCPKCGNECLRHSIGKRSVKYLDGQVHYKISKHYCKTCFKYFSTRINGVKPNQKFGDDVFSEIYKLYKVGLKAHKIKERLKDRYNLEIGTTTIYDTIKSRLGS